MESSVANTISGNEKGFTLIEALVAIGIFSIVMLATATMLFTGMSASVSGNSRFIAGSLAQGQVDNLMKMPFDNVSSHRAPLPPVTVDGRPFFTNWSTSTLGTTGLRPFVVTTRWTDKSGNHVVTLTGVRAP
jgi:prepilin-type N-terminal cleavage/methylation domain-containing protein